MTAIALPPAQTGRTAERVPGPTAAGNRVGDGPAERRLPLSARWIGGYALFWVAGLGFLWWPVIAVRALFLGRGRHRAERLPVAVAALLGVSLVVAAVTGAELTRVAGAAYNLVVWVSLAALTRYALDLRGLCRGIAQLAAVQSLAVLAALAVYPAFSGTALPATYVLPGALTQDPAFQSFTLVRLIDEDYFGETVLRSAGFFGNATWGGALSCLGIIATCSLVGRGASRTARLLYFVGAVLDAVVLYLSYSRNSWLALGLALVAMTVLQLRRRGRWFLLSALVAGLALVVGWAVTSLDVAVLMDDFNSVREGSYDSRTDIYAHTWRGVVDLPFPLLGNGVKDRVPGLVASLGTHSTYLGILYRGGWLAVVLLLVWLGTLAIRTWRAGSAVGVGAAVFAAGWFVAEDLDAGHLAPLALVVAVAATRATRAAPPTSTG